MFYVAHIVLVEPIVLGLALVMSKVAINLG